jgi:hypothetical protein
VPPGMTIAGQSTGTVEVWLRGSDFLFDSVNPETLVARCDLSTAHERANTIQLRSSNFEVPFGFRIEGITPRQVNVRLASTSATHADER